MLKGDRIFLRLVEHKDAAMILSWEKTDELLNITEFDSLPSIQLMERLIDEQRNVFESGQIRFVVCLKDSNLPIGLVDLYNIDFITEMGEIGVVIVNEKNRKQGYAGDALRLFHKHAHDVLGVQCILARVGKENTASNTLFSSLGYELRESLSITQDKNEFKIMFEGL
jgi:diamine N-acetyltransferase